MHPGQAADLYVSGEKVGFFGVLTPEIVEALDIKAQRPSILLMELAIDSLIPYSERLVKYTSLPRYPYVERDTAIVVRAELQAASVVKWLKSYSSDLIEDIALFDVYQGGNIPEGSKSVAFNVRYRASDRTLTDAEVDGVHKGLVEYILDKTKGQLRQ